MKKLQLLALLLVLFSCTAIVDEEDFLAETDVRIEFYTTEPNYDEIEFSYYDNATDRFNDETLVFNYDNSGNALPIIINWEDFGFKYVDVKAYRNNNSAAELKLKLYVNDELVDEDINSGTSMSFASVAIYHTIRK